MNRDRISYLRNDSFTGSGSPSIGGSREHFFHFLLGYLLPLVYAQSKERFGDFLVLDCGPLMNPILKSTLDRLHWNFEIVQPVNIEKCYYLEEWDHRWNSLESVKLAVDKVITAWEVTGCNQSDCPTSKNIIIQRSDPHPYYLNGNSEISGYGTSRRSIINLEEIHSFLIKVGIDHAIYEPGRHSLGCQIQTFRRASRILGIRGSEWANTIWCHPEARLKIFDPNPPATILTNFLNRIGINFKFDVVSTNSLILDIGKVLNFLLEK